MSIEMKGMLAAMAAVMMCGCVSDKEEPEWSLQVGDALPSFRVTTLDGATVTSEDSYKMPLVIVFFNTTCVDCQRELPKIQKEYEENLQLPENEQSQYICISREEGPEDVSAYWEETGLTMPVSAQPDRKIYSQFASIGIPRIYNAREGVITYTFP